MVKALPLALAAILTLASSGTQGAEPFSAAKKAVTLKLSDPGSAQWRGLFKAGEVICGQVNAKNRMGGYAGFRGFIYKQGRATVMFTGASDPNYTGRAAADYCRSCLTNGKGDRAMTPHCPPLLKAYP